MHSIKPVLRIDKAKANGDAPLYIRIIKERKPTYKALKFYLNPSHWDEKLTKVRKSHPNSVRLNNQISQKIAALSDAMLKLEDSTSPYHTAKVFSAVQGGRSIGLLEYAYTVLDRMEASISIGTARRYKAVISKVSTYLNNKDIPIIDVTVSWLKNYETYLRRQLNNQTNTIAANMKALRKIFNDADREDLLLVGKNPFDRYAIITVSTEVEHFSEEDLTAIMNVQLTPGTKIEQHRDLFVFACYAGGIRIGDLLKLKWKNFDGERIMLSTSKTREPISIKLAGVPLDIISRQTSERSPEGFIFGLLPANLDMANKQALHNAISSATTYVNTSLKIIARKAGIEKNIHFHMSRHTWATRALRKGMRIEHVSKLLTHRSIKTTQIYAKIVNADLDAAMEVFND